MHPILDMLIAGVKGGAVVFALAFLFRRFDRLLLALALIDASFAYVLFARSADPQPPWIAIELVGVALVGVMGLLGVRRSGWWLVAGWALHPIWDVGLHYFGPGHTFAPEAYAISCVSWDWVVAGLFAVTLLRSRPGMSSALKTHFEAALAAAALAEHNRDVDGAWRALERAHVLSQAYAGPHLKVHAKMFSFALRHGDLRELFGQLPRLALAAPGSWSGRAPLGNTGRANVGIFTPMAIPADLRTALEA